MDKTAEQLSTREIKSGPTQASKAANKMSKEDNAEIHNLDKSLQHPKRIFSKLLTLQQG